MMKHKLIGICACSLIVTAMMRLCVPRVEVSADIYVPFLYVVLAIVAASAVYKERIWGYWLSLIISILQLVAIGYVMVILFDGRFGMHMFYSICKDFSVLISVASSLMLIIQNNKQNKSLHSTASS